MFSYIIFQKLFYVAFHIQTYSPPGIDFCVWCKGQYLYFSIWPHPIDPQQLIDITVFSHSSAVQLHRKSHVPITMSLFLNFLFCIVGLPFHTVLLIVDSQKTLISGSVSPLNFLFDYDILGSSWPIAFPYSFIINQQQSIFELCIFWSKVASLRPLQVCHLQSEMTEIKPLLLTRAHDREKLMGKVAD